MAFRSANRYENSLAALRAAGGIFDFVHPDYKYYKPDWDLIRDLIAGERRMKELGANYLPPLGKDSGTTYQAYLERAVYVNMVARTLNGQMGSVFRRPIKIKGLGPNQRDLMNNITVEGYSLNAYAKMVFGEVAAIGRVGLLMDRAEDGQTAPYFTMYLAENILSWKEEMRNGRRQLTYVLLREIIENPRINDTGNFFQPPVTPDQDNQLFARYRVLRLTPEGEYIQELYETNDLEQSTINNLPSVPVAPTRTIKPTRNGQALDYIPMVILGAQGVGSHIQKSPMFDIATLNLAHYRTSAQLEHGRFFTALPVYYVSKAPGQDEAEYVIGPSVVWEVAQGEKPGILEYFGTGLTALSNSLVEKEEAIAQLGGRIMGIRAAATSEAESIFKLKQANEMATLIDMTESISDALTTMCSWYFAWENRERLAESVRIELNQDFKALMWGARELRALALLYQEGILPLNEVYRVLQEAELIDDDVTLDDFKRMLEDPAQFLNQPNPEAMRQGFASAESRDSTRNKALDREADQRLAEENRRAAEEAARRQNPGADDNPAARRTQELERREQNVGNPDETE